MQKIRKQYSRHTNEPINSQNHRTPWQNQDPLGGPWSKKRYYFPVMEILRR